MEMEVVGRGFEMVTEANASVVWWGRVGVGLKVILTS